MEQKNIPFQFLEFADTTAHLKAFLKLRDSDSQFDVVKQKGQIGIPCFLLADGLITLELNEALLHRAE